jgi:hypothetical protein
LVVATIGLCALGYFVGSPDCRVQNGQGPKIADAIMIAGCPVTGHSLRPIAKKHSKPFSIS